MRGLSRRGLSPVRFGSMVKNVTINRSEVADNCVGKAILLKNDPEYAHIAFDQTNKCAVYVTQDDIIKYGLSPRTYYIFLIARLNTDMMGNVHGDDFVVEYLRLSDNVYQEFVTNAEEIWDSSDDDEIRMIKLKKETKKGNGADFSYVKPYAMGKREVPSPSLINKIKELRNSPALDKMWELVDINCAKSIEEYEKILEGNQNSSDKPRSISDREVRSIRQAAQGEAPIPGKQLPFSPKDEPDDVSFEEADDFSDDDEFEDK